MSKWIPPSFLSQDRYALLYPSFGPFFWVPLDLGCFSLGLWLPCSEVLRLGVGAHGWVAWICQPWERSQFRSWLAATSGSSWMSRAPNLHFARQLLNAVKYNLTELTTRSTSFTLQFVIYARAKIPVLLCHRAL